MGAAFDYLRESEREAIARGMLAGVSAHMVGDRIGANCPFHSESTPGGAFFYNPKDDVGHCFSCAETDDLIGIFCRLNGFDANSPEGFREFFQRFAPERFGDGKKREPREAMPAPAPWKARPAEDAPGPWLEKATAWVDKCAARLLETPEALHALSAWGITPETAAKCRIGWNEKDKFPKLTDWGLPAAVNAKGNPACIHLPKGLVFPVYSNDGARRLLRAKVRLAEPKDNEPKYKAVKGGATAVYGVWGKADFPAWVVVETERDGMLIWQEMRGLGIGGMAVGTAKVAPDTDADAILRGAYCIVNALDNDDPGARASWNFDPSGTAFAWNSAYPQAIRLPVPCSLGKDAGDLPKSGVGVRGWLEACLPPHVLRLCAAYARKARAAVNEEEI